LTLASKQGILDKILEKGIAMEYRATLMESPADGPRFSFFGLGFFILAALLTLIWIDLQDARHAEFAPRMQDLPPLHNLNNVLAPATAAPAVVAPATVVPAPITTPTQHSITIKRSSSLTKILQELGLDKQVSRDILALGKPVAGLRHLTAGKVMQVQLTSNHQLLMLEYPISPLQTLVISTKDNKLVAATHNVPIERHTHVVSGRITSTLAHAAKQAGLPAKLTNELSTIFKWQINFSRSLRPGDQFHVLYQDTYAGDQKINGDSIIAVKFQIHNKIYSAIRYTLPNGESHYYTPEGESLEKSFMRVPLQYSRVSSAFSLARSHPVLNVVRPHKGIDLVAPKGSKIHATANGVVKFVGRNGGYGKLVVLEHSNGYRTRYGHMMQFANNIHVGKTVQKGEVIGYVGSTGLATGPHLHYEVSKNQKEVDPLKVTLPSAPALSTHARNDFILRANNLLDQLDFQRSN
jgi:murein DD-endopeptidase MepM/ murein hydrolase activator NlpD